MVHSLLWQDVPTEGVCRWAPFCGAASITCQCWLVSFGLGSFTFECVKVLGVMRRRREKGWIGSHGDVRNTCRLLMSRQWGKRNSRNRQTMIELIVNDPVAYWIRPSHAIKSCHHLMSLSHVIISCHDRMSWSHVTKYGTNWRYSRLHGGRLVAKDCHYDMDSDMTCVFLSSRYSSYQTSEKGHDFCKMLHYYLMTWDSLYSHISCILRQTRRRRRKRGRSRMRTLRG